ncbi:MAG: ATP-binding cassette domain-containing protein [Chryseolinea sp.]
MIELRNVTVRKGASILYSDLNWKIEKGQHWLITGPNGSGKTTMLELLAGQIPISKGEMHIDFISGGTWDQRYAERKSKIHFIPANAGQSLLGYDREQYYQQRYYGIGDERTPLVRDVLMDNVTEVSALKLPESFAIDQLLPLEITRLSNGQLKKVLLLKVLLSGTPSILLLDYPFEGLDETSRKDLCSFLDDSVAHFGMQIILVDHHHQLPTVINKKLTLDQFRVIAESDYLHSLNGEHPRQVVAPTQRGTQPVVEIRNMTIQYGDKVVLKDFNWLVRKGEKWALIGRNGAGKTTLFSMIFADHPLAYTQEIYLFGRRRGSGESIWDIKRRISYLGPEQGSYLSSYYMNMSARHYLKLMNKSGKDSLFEKISLMFNMHTLLDKHMRILSSGERQLVMSVSCFLHDTEMLLLDEPFQFLDTDQRSNLSRLLRSALQGDKTLILITHDQSDLLEWTDHTMHI